MKTTIFFLCVLAIFLTDCNSEKKPLISVYITVVVDITDPRKVLADAGTILSLYGFAIDENREAWLRLTKGTDKVFTPGIELYLPPGSITEKENHFDNPDYRKHTVIEFYSKARNAIAAFNTAIQKDSTTVARSECFRSLARELHAIKEKGCTNNIMLYYGDLAENSDLFTLTSLEQSIQQPESIIKRFEETNLLPENLAGFTIYFIFEPYTRKDDTIFAAMAKIYATLLSKRGATVFIRADNPSIP